MPRIFFGGAAVRRYGENFAITYFDRVFRHGREKRFSVYLTAGRLSRYKHRSHLIALLDAATEASCYATCYCFGSLVPSEKPAWLDAEIAHLDNLVVIVRSKQRK